ncbi:hypothetical protein BP6252_12520 [Coleophoma cylindrospora]|uniref:Transcription factor domain-containing protein n=1 Tax=Coleophoma cylindrospora TaxID=1849047 RepID=A0A3D8QC51_9HELO|nr:hypothetical protein BP6252_12520 [Coleophoma cylindrospora]
MQPPNPRRRNPAKAVPRAQAAQIARLERRLDGLASLLESSGQPLTGVDPGEDVLSSCTAASSDGSASASTPHVVSQSPESAPSYHTGSTISQNTPHSADSHGLESASFPSTQTRIITDPDQLLEIYRRDLARQMPFCSIPPEVTAQTLSMNRPFLYRAVIVAASYHDSIHQCSLSEDFMRYITERHILGGVKNLDVLQGIIVYTLWSNGLVLQRLQMNTLLGLALALAIELSLFTAPCSFESHEQFLPEMKRIIDCNRSWVRWTETSKEEKRTVLGCFYLFSFASVKFACWNPLHWTPYIHHCHKYILENPESDADIYIAHLSGLQRIADTIKNISIQNLALDPSSRRGSIAIHVKLLTSELQKFMAALPEKLQQDSLMLVHYHAVETKLFELGFSMPPTNLVHGPSPQRADLLLLCLSACQKLTKSLLSLDCETFANFSATNTAHISVAMSVSSKLMLFHAEDWDVNNVPLEMDLPTLIGWAVALIEDGSSRYDRVGSSKQPWLELSRKIKLVGDRFNGLMAMENNRLFPQPVDQARDESMTNLFNVNTFDLFDDAFWQLLPVAPSLQSK